MGQYTFIITGIIIIILVVVSRVIIPSPIQFRMKLILVVMEKADK